VDLEIKIKESKDLSRGNLSQVELQADHSPLDAMTLRVWIYEGAGGAIHELRMREFVELRQG
jgi:hypothetical protein